eukprot:Nk52_evm40s266 gene=Nk52_evmTU40s266
MEWSVCKRVTRWELLYVITIIAVLHMMKYADFSIDTKSMFQIGTGNSISNNNSNNNDTNLSGLGNVRGGNDDTKGENTTTWGNTSSKPDPGAKKDSLLPSLAVDSDTDVNPSEERREGKGVQGAGPFYTVNAIKNGVFFSHQNTGKVHREKKKAWCAKADRNKRHVGAVREPVRVRVGDAFLPKAKDMEETAVVLRDAVFIGTSDAMRDGPKDNVVMIKAFFQWTKWYHPLKEYLGVSDQQRREMLQKATRKENIETDIDLDVQPKRNWELDKKAEQGNFTKFGVEEGSGFSYVESCVWTIGKREVRAKGDLHKLSLEGWINWCFPELTHDQKSLQCMFNRTEVAQAHKEEGQSASENSSLSIRVGFYDPIFGRPSADGKWTRTGKFRRVRNTFKAPVTYPRNTVSKPFKRQVTEGSDDTVGKDEAVDSRGLSLNNWSVRYPQRRVVTSCLAPIFGTYAMDELKRWLRFHLPRHVDQAVVYLSLPNTNGKAAAGNYSVWDNSELQEIEKIVMPYVKTGQMVVRVWESFDETRTDKRIFYQSQGILFQHCLHTQARNSDYVLLIDRDEYVRIPDPKNDTATIRLPDFIKSMMTPSNTTLLGDQDAVPDLTDELLNDEEKINTTPLKFLKYLAFDWVSYPTKCLEPLMEAANQKANEEEYHQFPRLQDPVVEKKLATVQAKTVMAPAFVSDMGIHGPDFASKKTVAASLKWHHNTGAHVAHMRGSGNFKSALKRELNCTRDAYLTRY